MPPSPLRPILLVDDNEEDLSLTQLLLQKSEIMHPVVVAIGGEQAIELLRKTRTDRLPFIVLCDVRMPQVGGLEVLKWVRTQPRLSEIYFAMHSGGDVPADRGRARALGADEYLVKFPTKAQIRAIVAHAQAKWKKSDSPAPPSEPEKTDAKASGAPTPPLPFRTSGG
jgi:CheY-like chemotaxis protein